MTFFVKNLANLRSYSRESFCQTLEAFHKEGLVGLVDKPKGKTKPDKVTPEIIGFVIYQRAKFGLSGTAIAKKIVQEFKLKLQKRTVESIIGSMRVLNIPNISV